LIVVTLPADVRCPALAVPLIAAAARQITAAAKSALRTPIVFLSGRRSDPNLPA
jgi:hypothetical protein